MTTQNRRVEEIDFGRGLAVFLMMLVHTLWMYADQHTQGETWFGDVIHFIGKGTPAFLLTMGMSFILTKNQSLKSALIKGAMILAFAYVMNFLKFVVPIKVFGTMPESFVAAYGFSSPISFGEMRYIFLTGDILQMAGISFMAIGVIRYFTQNKWIYLAIAIFIAGISKELSGFQLGIDGVDYILKLFFSSHYQVYFPVFPWMSFIVFGMFMGKLIEENLEDIRIFFNKLPKMAAVTLIPGIALCYWQFDYHFDNFFHLGFGGFLYLLGINLILFLIIHKIVQSNSQNFFVRFLYFCSERVTSMYIIQWVLICWGMGIIGFQTMNVWQTAMLMPIVVVLTVLIQLAKDKLFEQLSNHRLKAATS